MGNLADELCSVSFSLSKVTVPPMASVNFLTTGKPKSCSLAFVVNKGVKILSLISPDAYAIVGNADYRPTILAEGSNS